ncbi:MAG: hypothetical protein FWB74_09075 [Defluviitaleaceae bacterium]|nr:hypothetical protein [Defluviitaleaceae bacterium]
MYAVRGVYDNGKLTLLEDAPQLKANVIVQFVENISDKSGNRAWTEEDEWTEEDIAENLRLFEYYSGWLKGVDPVQAKDEYLERKYGPFN